MKKNQRSTSCGESCGCSQPGLGRREFLKVVSLGAGAAALAPWEAMAGPFTRADFASLVPADKKLRPEWVRSLYARGARAVYQGAELEKIGMPIGGLCAGQVYLGGDGKLWHWDIFNRRIATGAEHYAKPMAVNAPFEQGFALRVTAAGAVQERLLQRGHWRDIKFTGEYPIGYVEYGDPECPVRVALEAFSPFIPLNVEDSSLPATVMRFTVTNTGAQAVEAALAGWLENAVCLQSGQARGGQRRNRLVRRAGLLGLEASAEAIPDSAPSQRPDVVIDRFEDAAYGRWTATGTAFGSGPVAMSAIPSYQGDVGGQGQRVVNSHASAPGRDVGEKDAARGTLTSPPFRIERHYLTCLIGGGAHRGKTCLNLLVDGQVVLSATGANDNRMKPLSWDVRRWAGQTARLQIVDEESGGWGNIGVDDLILSDQPRVAPGPLEREPDFGTFCLALLDTQDSDFGHPTLEPDALPRAAFNPPAAAAQPARRSFEQKLLGALTRPLRLAPGQSATVTFVVAWHLPNLQIHRLPPGRYYAHRFVSALAVAEYLAVEFTRLQEQTRLWHDTWYEGTLPYWFLDRTFLNASILATSTCYRLGNGRFWAWEGVGCCEGTCGHVWQYAHAMARLFPELERATREKVDFDLALQPDGAIFFRGEFNNIPAIDAQAGTVLRALREHQMAPDAAFLQRTWPRIRRATEWLIAKDVNGDGLIEGNQHNTLDTDWFGPVAWLSGMYLAALQAAEVMALEVGDQTFAQTCREIVETGRKRIVAELFAEDYFINKPDPKHPDAINSGTGCHIDQVFGQSWAFQVGLDRVLPERETLAALRALWRYNFTPDVGPYRQAYKPGRWYAMPGEAGLLMCTFPRTDWDYPQAKGKGADWAAGYFNECMNGFEYQVAGHMLWEGLIQEGLAVTRAIHDRYHPLRRNPWNEVECGDHYARSMASYGVFLAACGYEYHGPQGRLGFAPRLTPERFQAAFTTAEGWGVFRQRIEAGQQTGTLALKWGQLRLKTLVLAAPADTSYRSVTATVGGTPVTAQLRQDGRRITLTLGDGVQLVAGQSLTVVLG